MIFRQITFFERFDVWAQPDVSELLTVCQRELVSRFTDATPIRDFVLACGLPRGAGYLQP